MIGSILLRLAGSLILIQLLLAEGVLAYAVVKIGPVPRDGPFRPWYRQVWRVFRLAWAVVVAHPLFWAGAGAVTAWNIFDS